MDTGLHRGTGFPRRRGGSTSARLNIWLALGFLVLLSFNIAGFASNRERIHDNARLIRHLCFLTQTTDAVWSSAMTSYTSLPNKTPDQVKLLAELKTGVAAIRSDKECK